MRMALCASGGQAQPRGARNGNSICHGMKSKLQRINSAFFVEHRISMKATGNFLRDGRIGKHIARQLFNRKLIEGHVLIERIDNPVSIGPNGSGSVFFITVGVGISRQIQPDSSPAFSIFRTSQKMVGQFLPDGIACKISIGQLQSRYPLLSFLHCRRQTDQIQKHASHQNFRFGTR